MVQVAGLSDEEQTAPDILSAPTTYAPTTPSQDNHAVQMMVLDSPLGRSPLQNAQKLPTMVSPIGLLDALFLGVALVGASPRAFALMGTQAAEQMPATVSLQFADMWAPCTDTANNAFTAHSPNGVFYRATLAIDNALSVIGCAVGAVAALYATFHTRKTARGYRSDVDIILYQPAPAARKTARPVVVIFAN